jgi:hypothetical protein
MALKTLVALVWVIAAWRLSTLAELRGERALAALLLAGTVPAAFVLLITLLALLLIAVVRQPAAGASGPSVSRATREGPPLGGWMVIALFMLLAALVGLLR